MKTEAIEAIERRDIETLKAILSDGLDPNALGEDGRTLLMHAVMGERADAGMAAFLIQRGADPNVADRLLGWTALHYAVRDGKEAIVEVLIEAGADANVEDTFGDTPLWRCVTGTAPSARIMRLLIGRGANPFKAHRIGISARDIAVSLEQDELVAALS
jgi:uncharacterized protein